MINELKNRMKNKQTNQFLRKNHINIDFKILDDFIYHVINDKDRLCIFEI